jgi:hypothetical protein
VAWCQKSLGLGLLEVLPAIRLPQARLANAQPVANVFDTLVLWMVGVGRTVSVHLHLGREAECPRPSGRVLKYLNCAELCVRENRRDPHAARKAFYLFGFGNSRRAGETQQE